MMFIGKIYIVATIIIAFLAIYVTYQPIQVKTDTASSAEVKKIQVESTNWSEMFLRLSQFEPKLDEAALAAQKALEEQSTKKFDPNDISRAKFVGLVLAKPSSAMIVLPVDSTSQNSRLETVTVNEGDTILDGWQLNIIDQTTIEWRHADADKVVRQRLFADPASE